MSETNFLFGTIVFSFSLLSVSAINQSEYILTKNGPYDGSYNSFRQQVGFCKLQGFDTISRSTSHGPKAFVNGDVWIGVGMNDIDFQHDVSNCGRCLEISQPSNWIEFSTELDTYHYLSLPKSTNYLAMIMDECQDPICTKGFLDFDIYSPLQPVKDGNPTNIQWSFVQCPSNWSDVEFLFCFSNTCHEDDPCNRTHHQVLQDANPYFFSVYLRNTPLPIQKVVINDTFSLEKKEGWFWNFGYIHLQSPFSIHLYTADDEKNPVVQRWIDFMRRGSILTSCAFRGGILWN